MSMKKVGKRKAVAEAEASAPPMAVELVNEHEDVQNETVQLRRGAMAFYTRLKKKPWITEGKFLPSPTVQNGNLADQIKSRRWEQLVTQHIMPCREVVLEFLANLSADPEADEVRVRGIMVSFTPEEINRIYNLRDFDHAAFDQLEASPNFDMIVTEMCSPGTTWSKPGNIDSGSYFPGASLNRVAKAWMLFIASNLLPYTKPHVVTRRRVVLLYCICSGRSINIGRLLNKNIKRVTTDGKVLSICHGSLITQLCIRAGVSINAQEARMGLGKAITDASIEMVKPWVGGSEDPDGLGFRDHQATAPATARAHAQGEARRKNRADVRAAGVESSSSGSATLVAQMQAMELGYNARFDELQHSNDALGQSFNSLGAWQAEFGERCILEHNYRRAMDTARIEREMARMHIHQQDYGQSSFTPYPEPPVRLREPFPRSNPIITERTKPNHIFRFQMAATRRVGIVYDERMCGHATTEEHPENPDRVRAIWAKLQTEAIIPRCVVVDGVEADDDDLLLVHSKSHVNLIRTISSKSPSQMLSSAAKFNSVYFNDSSSLSASVAAGSLLRLCRLVASGDLRSGAAIVRPPGHHAERDRPMGFCLFNNVAVAAAGLLREGLASRILIVDWDVHHGNATQKMFYSDPRVLFFSVHRHDHGTFYPATDDGSHSRVGSGRGRGFNVNVPWEHGGCGDPDYLAAWDHVLLPVARSFGPDLVIVSAGFDSAEGDPLGGCRVSPLGYSLLLQRLTQFAGGKLVLALEGGYNLESTANSALACLRVLLCDPQPPTAPMAMHCPFRSTWRVIRQVRKELSPFWPALAEDLPEDLTDRHVPYAASSSSDSDAEAPTANDIVERLSRLRVNEEGSKTEIWYASFGSNMWHPRFMCYIEGGQVEGMKKACCGCEDKTPPKDIAWKCFPHRLFFGRESTLTWGDGGVAFVNAAPTTQDKTFMCLYRITLEQFNDVVLQENAGPAMTSPLFDLAALHSFTTGESSSLEVHLERGWYRNVLYLGTEQDIPILTITCSISEMEGFKSGKLPLRAPSERYAKTLARGLVQGKQLSEVQAMAYIQQASSTPL